LVGLAEGVLGGGVVVGAGFGFFVLDGLGVEGSGEGVGARGTAVAGRRSFETGTSSSPPWRRSPVPTPVPMTRSATLAVSRTGPRNGRRLNGKAAVGAGYETR
jgi:hypothetical protein